MLLRIPSTLGLLLVCSSHVCAFEVVALPKGKLSLANNATVYDFDHLTQSPYGQTIPAGNFILNGATFSGPAVVMRNGIDGSASSLGLYAEPAHDHTNYLAIMSGREMISFNSNKTDFGLYWGSMDTFNKIVFREDGRKVAVFKGYALSRFGLSPDGNQTSDASNRYIQFSSLPQFDQVILASGGHSFEVDNITASSADAAPAPLAGAGLLSFIIAGGIAAVRRLKTRLPIAV